MSRPGSPLTKQRSAWVQFVDEDLSLILEGAGTVEPQLWSRQVHDGELNAFLGRSKAYKMGWHMSISWRGRTDRQAKRYPTWDEIAHARYELLPTDKTFLLVLPPPTEFVALHDTTFHLHEDTAREFSDASP